MELIYKGEVLEKETRTSGLEKEQRFEIEKYGTGWYKVRATADNGKTKIAWVKAINLSEALTIPIVTYEPEKPNGENGWYKGEKVEVKIETNSPSAKEIHYTLTGANAETGEKVVQGKTASFDITKSGITEIRIWAEDGRGYQSKEVARTIKLDNINPEISELKLEGTKGETDKNKKTWITSNGEIKIIAKDTGGSRKNNRI